MSEDKRSDKEKKKYISDLNVTNGCSCKGWKYCWKKIRINYNSYWDENYDENLTPILDIHIHEFSINSILIRRCPWCGEELPYETRFKEAQ